MFKRLISLFVTISFILSYYQPVYAQDFSVNQLPMPGTMVGESMPFTPLALKGLVINPQKPLEFQFIVDTGKGAQDTASVKDQANQLVKYFLAGLTIPEGDLWVNLSPYEKNRIVPAALGQTDLGRDLLAQDYILKQLTASLIYPEKDLGKEFWNRVYAKAQQQFGTTNVPVNTFNKVWILPDQAQVFEHGAAAYVTKATLKVMLDEDYTALQKHLPVHNSTDSIGSQIIRQIVIPEITKEVNHGCNFAPLRQIYQALILAKWYKETIQNGLLDAVYTNRNKVAGVDLKDPAIKEEIYNRYLQAYKKGAFNYIKDDPTPDGQFVPRKYFSGGFSFIWKVGINRKGTPAMISSSIKGLLFALTISLSAFMPAGFINAQPSPIVSAQSNVSTPINAVQARAGPDAAMNTVNDKLKENLFKTPVSSLEQTALIFEYAKSVKKILFRNDPTEQAIGFHYLGHAIASGVFDKDLINKFGFIKRAVEVLKSKSITIVKARAAMTLSTAIKENIDIGTEGQEALWQGLDDTSGTSNELLHVPCADALINLINNREVIAERILPVVLRLLREKKFISAYSGSIALLRELVEKNINIGQEGMDGLIQAVSNQELIFEGLKLKLGDEIEPEDAYALNQGVYEGQFPKIKANALAALEAINNNNEYPIDIGTRSSISQVLSLHSQNQVEQKVENVPIPSVDKLPALITMMESSLENERLEAIEGIRRIMSQNIVSAEEITPGITLALRDTSPEIIKTGIECVQELIKQDQRTDEELIGSLLSLQGRSFDISDLVVPILKQIMDKGYLQPVSIEDIDNYLALFNSTDKDPSKDSDELRARFTVLLQIKSILEDKGINPADIKYVSEAIDKTDKEDLLPNMLFVILRWSKKGSSEAQNYLEARINQIYRRRAQPGQKYVAISEKDKFFIATTADSFRAVSLIPILVSNKFDDQVRTEVRFLLAQAGYIDSGYLQFTNSLEPEVLEYITELYDRFGYVPPKLLIDKLISKEVSIDQLNQEKLEIDKVVAKHDHRLLIKYLAEDEKRAIAYYLLYQSPFQYPGTETLSFERFQRLLKDTAEKLDKENKDIVLIKLKEGYIQAGLDEKRAQEIAEAILQGRPPLPKDSPFLDKDGNFIPQKVDVLRSLDNKEELRAIKEGFNSTMKHIVLILKINFLYNQIVNKRSSSGALGSFFSRAGGLEYIRSDAIKPLTQENLEQMYARLVKINNKIYPPQGRKRSLENIMAQAINSKIRQVPWMMDMIDDPTNTSSPDQILLEKIDPFLIVLNQKRMLSQLREKQLKGKLTPLEKGVIRDENISIQHVMAIALDGLFDGLNFEKENRTFAPPDLIKNSKSRIFQQYLKFHNFMFGLLGASTNSDLYNLYLDTEGHLLEHLNNYVQDVSIDTDINDIPPVVYVDFISKFNLIEFFRFADGGHCCLSSDPKIADQYNGFKTYHQELPRFMANATSFWWQFTTDARSGKQIGWYENWFGLHEGKVFVGTELLYISPSYRNLGLQKALLTGVEKILFSTKVTSIAQALPQHQPGNAMSPPSEYQAAEMKITKLQSLDDGRGLFEDSPIEINKEVSRILYVKQNTTDGAMLKESDLPKWFSKIPEKYRQQLIFRLDQVYSDIPHLLDLEKQYHLLGLYEYWLDIMANQWGVKDVDAFARAVAWQYAKAISDMYVHVQAFDQLGKDRHQVKSVLDLGPGYWDYAHTLQYTFDGADRFVGIESDWPKVSAYKGTTARVYHLDPQKYHMIYGNFLEAKNILKRDGEQAPFDVVLLQNPQTQYYSESFWDALPELLGKQGVMIITIDGHRLNNDGNPELIENIKPFIVKEFDTKRITFQYGIPQDLRVFVLRGDKAMTMKQAVGVGEKGITTGEFGILPAIEGWNRRGYFDKDTHIDYDHPNNGYDLVVWRQFSGFKFNIGLRYKKLLIPFLQIEVMMGQVVSAERFVTPELFKWFVGGLIKNSESKNLGLFLQGEFKTDQYQTQLSIMKSSYGDEFRRFMGRANQTVVKIQSNEGSKKQFVDVASGFFTEIDKQYYLITAKHVILKQSNQFRAITSDQKIINLELIGVAKDSDIAVFRLNEQLVPESQILPLTEGTYQGENAPAIEYGYNLQSSIKEEREKVSGVWGWMYGERGSKNITFDMPFTNGMSGGPLVNLLTGKIVGLNSMFTSTASTKSFVSKQILRKIIADRAMKITENRPLEPLSAGIFLIFFKKLIADRPAKEDKGADDKNWWDNVVSSIEQTPQNQKNTNEIQLSRRTFIRMITGAAAAAGIKSFAAEVILDQLPQSVVIPRRTYADLFFANLTPARLEFMANFYHNIFSLKFNYIQRPSHGSLTFFTDLPAFLAAFYDQAKQDPFFETLPNQEQWKELKNFFDGNLEGENLKIFRENPGIRACVLEQLKWEHWIGVDTAYQEKEIDQRAKDMFIQKGTYGFQIADVFNSQLKPLAESLQSLPELSHFAYLLEEVVQKGVSVLDGDPVFQMFLNRYYRPRLMFKKELEMAKKNNISTDVINEEIDQEELLWRKQKNEWKQQYEKENLFALKIWNWEGGRVGADEMDSAMTSQSADRAMKSFTRRDFLKGAIGAVVLGAAAIAGKKWLMGPPHAPMTTLDKMNTLINSSIIHDPKDLMAVDLTTKIARMFFDQHSFSVLTDLIQQGRIKICKVNDQQMGDVYQMAQELGSGEKGYIEEDGFTMRLEYKDKPPAYIVIFPEKTFSNAPDLFVTLIHELFGHIVSTQVDGVPRNSTEAEIRAYTIELNALEEFLKHSQDILDDAKRFLNKEQFDWLKQALEAQQLDAIKKTDSQRLENYRKADKAMNSEEQLKPATEDEAVERVGDNVIDATFSQLNYGPEAGVRLVGLSSLSIKNKLKPESMFVLGQSVSGAGFKGMHLSHKEMLNNTPYAWKSDRSDWTLIDFRFSSEYGKLPQVTILPPSVSNPKAEMTDALAEFKGVDKNKLPINRSNKNLDYEISVRDELIYTARIIYKALLSHFGEEADNVQVTTEWDYFPELNSHSLKLLAEQRPSFDAAMSTKKKTAIEAKPEILIIDDRDINIWQNRIELRKLADHYNFTFKNFEDGLKLIKQKKGKFSLLITDTKNEIGKIQGPELAEKVQRIDPQLPIVAVSFSSSSEYAYTDMTGVTFYHKFTVLDTLGKIIEDHRKKDGAMTTDALVSAEGKLDLGRFEDVITAAASVANERTGMNMTVIIAGGARYLLSAARKDMDLVFVNHDFQKTKMSVLDVVSRKKKNDEYYIAFRKALEEKLSEYEGYHKQTLELTSGALNVVLIHRHTLEAGWPYVEVKFEPFFAPYYSEIYGDSLATPEAHLLERITLTLNNYLHLTDEAFSQFLYDAIKDYVAAEYYLGDLSEWRKVRDEFLLLDEHNKDAVKVIFQKHYERAGELFKMIQSSQAPHVELIKRKSERLRKPLKDLAQISGPGGIDLNQINVKRAGKTINVQFDPAQLNELEQSNFKGFTPVITGFRYIQSPFPLLGINTPAKEPELAKA